MKLLEKLVAVLEKNNDFVVDGQLLKNKVIESAIKADVGLLTLLASDENMKKVFFVNIENGMFVFDKDKFIRFISSKEFLPDSYTAFKNKIGLFSNGEYLKTDKSISIVWPYKDCVLEGGQSKEDKKTNEIFWNEVIAPDETEFLLKPKTFTNFKKVSFDGKKIVEEVDFELNPKDNLIVKGNNLLALHSLKERFKGQIKLIYIDPPYNTGNDGFNYNDSFNHATWLTFMKNRLEVAKELLKNNGLIFINLDDNEAHYCKVLCDEIFGRSSYIGSIAWKKTTGDNKPAFAFTHDNILIYGNGHKNLPRHKLDTHQIKQYKNPDNDPRGKWAETDYRSKWTKEERPNLYYGIKNPNTEEVIYPDTYSESLRVWGCDEQTHNARVKDNIVWWGLDGKGTEPKKKRFLDEHKGQNTRSVWLDAGFNDDASQHLRDLFGSDVFDNPKPEKLIQKILNIAIDEGDIVLDYHLGSGTTAATAHKLGIQYIGIEQMDYIETISIERLKKVLSGEQGGISQSVEWRGGGSFVYCELMQLNAKYFEQIEVASTSKELESILYQVLSEGYIKYKIDPEVCKQEFASIDNIEDKKRALIDLLDKNYLYVNYSEVNDTTHAVSDKDKSFNQQFYSVK